MSSNVQPAALSVKARPSPRFYEKYAWVILAVLSVLLIVIGAVSYLPSVLAPDPVMGSACCAGKSLKEVSWFSEYATERQRISAAVVVSYSILALLVVVNSYRRGEKWAWFAMWTMPLISVVQSFYIGFIDIPLIVLSLLGLFLPIRRFFSRA